MLAPLALAAFLAILSCGEPADVARLELQGEAGSVAIQSMDGHGGLARFLELEDLEYKVLLEEHNTAGVVTNVARELHRFPTAPPLRYFVHRAGNAQVELGLWSDEGWVRVNGVMQGNEAARQAMEELSLLAVLNRAPFCLADPETRLSLLPEDADGSESAHYHRLVAERPSGEAEPERFVFFVNRTSGRLEKILFRARGGPGGPPLRIARVLDTITLAGVELVSRWSLAPANSRGEAVGLGDMEWSVTDSRVGLSFPAALYEGGAGSLP